MAASASDLLQKVSIATATTLDAPGYTIGDTSITVASTSTWPTDTGITFAIDEVDANGDRVAGSYNEYVGVVSSGTSVTSVSHVNGTNRNYTAGTTTRVYIPVSEERENRIVTWGLTHADQDGTLKAGAVDVAAVLASDVVTTAKILDANVTNAKLATGAGQPGGAWTSWTPTLSGRLNNTKWDKTCSYTVIGKTCIFRIRLVANAATPMDGGSGDATFSLPGTTATYTNTSAYEIGKAGIFDTSAPFSYDGTITLASTTTANIKIHSSGGTYTGIDGIISTAPMTWASGDEITGTGIIELV